MIFPAIARQGGTVRPVVAIVLALIGLGPTLLLVYRAGDLIERSYATLADARLAGEVDRGWLPDYLPSSSRNIRLINRVEHARTWCAFDFLPSESDAFRQRLAVARSLPALTLRMQGPGTRWWPEVLQGEVDVAGISKAGYTQAIDIEPAGIPAFPNERYVYLFVIDWSAGHAYFYQTIGRGGG